jgi:hypothetical protein
MPTDMRSLRKVEEFDTYTAEIDKEVTLYDGEGEVRAFFRVRQCGTIVIMETRKPGKASKLVSMDDYERTYSAEVVATSAITDREKRVPVIRKEKAEAKLLSLIKAANADIVKLLAWSKNGSNNVLFDTREQTMKDHYIGQDELALPETEMAERIMSQLRHQGDSYFGGLKLVRRFIDQIKPGGLADQTIEGVIASVEQNLVPWAYVAGALAEPVMMSQNKRDLAVKLIERHTHRSSDDMGFFPEGVTAKSLIDRVYSNAIEDVKPGVLDALTLE